MSRPAVMSDTWNSAVFHINEAMKTDNNYVDLSDQLGVFRYSKDCCSVRRFLTICAFILLFDMGRASCGLPVKIFAQLAAQVEVLEVNLWQSSLSLRDSEKNYPVYFTSMRLSVR